MVSSSVTVVSEQGTELRKPGVARLSVASTAEVASAGALGPLLRIPPFPAASVAEFAASECVTAAIDGVAEKLRDLRVGGTFWAAQPELPEEYVLVRTAAALDTAHALSAGLPVVLWQPCTDVREKESGALIITGECDPWHVLDNASKLVATADDDLLPIAALLDVEIYQFDPATSRAVRVEVDPHEVVTGLASCAFQSPFTGDPMSALEAIELCGFWRKLIDSNRDIKGGFGFAFWKHAHVEPLLWDGSGSFPFLRSAVDVQPGASVAVWRSKVSTATLEQLERAGTTLIEVEDGFIRSRGLGADCIPPLSITVDRLGAYFDPTQPSELELLLQNGEFDEPLLERARELRRSIVQAGVGKYSQGHSLVDRLGGERRHILVPGQVEDDRAVTAGGSGLTCNLELLKRVRKEAPDAYVMYKPHPDVLAGHRRGAIPQGSCLQFADEIAPDVPISSLIEMVDEVHVNTSLAGFEALLRLKPVTTYGVPFYAGWGLTRDLGPVPARRTKSRSVDELVAATLLLYPRYLDPVTGLPCPAEVLVSRLAISSENGSGVIVAARRLQGKLMRCVRSMVQ